MKPLKIATLYALDVYYGEKLVQVNCYRYKKDALKDAEKYGKFEIVKRKVITDKY
jgi:hypothetical protein